MRILEIGAGTGGLAAHVLPLLERGLHSYTFTDVSAGFFTPAAQKLAAFPEVEFKVFDLEKSGAVQDIELGSFDFVIGTNCVHAVADVRTALRNVHDLLAPGGTFFFMDTASPTALDGRGFWTDQRMVAIHSITTFAPSTRCFRGRSGRRCFARWGLPKLRRFRGFAAGAWLEKGEYRGAGPEGMGRTGAAIPASAEPAEKSSADLCGSSSGCGDELAARLRAAGS